MGELVADDSVLAGLVRSLLSVIDVMTREIEKLTKRALDEVRGERVLQHVRVLFVRWQTRVGGNRAKHAEELAPMQSSALL